MSNINIDKKNCEKVYLSAMFCPERFYAPKMCIVCVNYM